MAVATFYISRDEDNTAGGWKHTALPVTGGTFTDDYDASEWQCRKVFTGAQYQYSNTFFRFNTAGLPQDAVITATARASRLRSWHQNP